MIYDELRQHLLELPGATTEWLSYTLSAVDGGRPLPTSYCLVRRADDLFLVFKGDERGGAVQAKAEDGETPLTFGSETAACGWIWDEIMWLRAFEARRADARGGGRP